MADVNWGAVITAGVTAVFVTFGFEYLAKPSLEARKERILDAHRARGELYDLIVRVTFAAGRFQEKMPGTAPAALRATWDDELDRQYEIMRTQILAATDNLGRYMRVYRGVIRGLVASYVTTLHGVILSPRTRDRQAEIVAGLGGPMATAITPPRPWRIPAWWRAVCEVRRLIDDTQVPADPPAAVPAQHVTP